MASKDITPPKEGKPKKPRDISRQTAIVHIVISFMYLVDTIIIPLTNTCSYTLITIALGINTLIVLLTGIIGMRASTERASIRITKWYMSLSVVCIVAAGLLMIAILHYFISSCGISPFANYSNIFSTYSVLSALFEITNSIISVFTFRNRLDYLKHKNINDNVEVTKFTKGNQAVDSNYDYNTIAEVNAKLYCEVDNFQTIKGKETTEGHPYEKTLQGPLELTRESQHIYPTVIYNHQDTSESSQQCRPDETTYIEMDNKLTPSDKCPDMTYIYDYTYMPPVPPPRPGHPILNQVPNEYLELYDNSDYSKKNKHTKSAILPKACLQLSDKSDEAESSTEVKHASHAERQTYFQNKFSSRFQTLPVKHTTPSIFLGKTDKKYQDAFANRLKCAIGNEDI